MTVLRVGACVSLSGRFARFGRQAAWGLEAWRALDGSADLVIEDDRSDRHAVAALLAGVAVRSDVVLGPYSTLLMRTAGQVAAGAGLLLWNHGGAGDNVQVAYPGHVVSVLTPASRYAEPFLRHLATGPRPPVELVIAPGRGSFGRQIADGAAAAARRMGIRPVRAGPEDRLARPAGPVDWALLCAGSFEEDVHRVGEARNLPHPPRQVCAVAAGVREFARAAGNPQGVFGIAQWFPGIGDAALGPAEAGFLAGYERDVGTLPDYPAVQAAAGAVLGAHCARLAGSTDREDLWQAAGTLDTSTVFGRFRIDPATGAQLGHQTVLLRWAAGELVPGSAPP